MPSVHTLPTQPNKLAFNNKGDELASLAGVHDHAAIVTCYHTYAWPSELPEGATDALICILNEAATRVQIQYMCSEIHG
jgi:hypothetical protein